MTQKLNLPTDSDSIISRVRQSKTKSTLRKYDRSLRHVAINKLLINLKNVDKHQRLGEWDEVERIVTSLQFKAFVQLSKMQPAIYAENWIAQRKRKGKKGSLLRLPFDWREQIASRSNNEGQNHIPMLVCLMTGCWPAEL